MVGWFWKPTNTALGWPGRIGFGNPERFDFVAPLGGPTDWTYMLEYIRRYHTGGFCTEDQRVADPEGCAMGASLDRTPPTTFLHEHAQTFENWWFEDENDGNSIFRRDDYISIFRDLATMFGNPNTEYSADPSEPNITPPGVPATERMRSDAERCATEGLIVIPPFDGDGDPTSGSEGAGFFDDEYNPDGQYPVITFCDGSDAPGDIGRWDPMGANRDPIDRALTFEPHTSAGFDHDILSLKLSAGRNIRRETGQPHAVKLQVRQPGGYVANRRGSLEPSIFDEVVPGIKAPRAGFACIVFAQMKSDVVTCF